MTNQTKELLRSQFLAFTMKAFAEMHPSQRMTKYPFLVLLAETLARVATGESKRVVVNLPPRHFKTFMGTICLTAWILAHNSSSKILIVTYGQDLADKIAYAVRAILQADWFRTLFKGTRLARNCSKLMDFVTTAGGGVRSVSIDGGVTGLGADVIIIDDPVQIKDCDHIEQLEHVNELFDGEVMTRLDNPKKGRIVVIAHRLNEIDLSGHLIAQGGWKQLRLPFIARRARSYELRDGEIWERKKGELLRPDAFTARDIEQRRAAKRPPFETLQQQNPSAKAAIRIKAANFASFSAPTAMDTGIVLSVDPGQKAGGNHSFCVIQAWARHGELHYLVDQFRAQVRYPDARRALRKYISRHRPTVVLVEDTGQGPSLLSEITAQFGMHVHAIVPIGEKSERLRRHLPIIRAGRIALPSNAWWREDFVAEMTGFPYAQTDDQVDAMTQYLDFISLHPNPGKRPNRAVVVGVNSRGMVLPARYSQVSMQTSRAGVLIRGSGR